MPFHPPKSNRRAWLRYATANAAEQQLVYTCREPTALERLAAHGFTRRASDGLVWFQHEDGRETPKRETLNAAVWVALEAIHGNR